jgi:glycosyltransferase involved in cell wall biosynthesis
MRILLNGINAISAGGKSVIKNITENIATISPDIDFDLVLPQDQGFDHWDSTQNMKIHLKKIIGNRTIGRLLDLHYNISFWCRKYKSDICFTLGDIGPIKLNIPHVVLLQQAIILYNDYNYEKYWSLLEKIKFNYTRWHFSKMIPNCDIISVQSPNMAKRLEQNYNFPKNKIKVVMSTLPGDFKDANKNKINIKMNNIDKPFRLLFLAAGYPHKNYAILPSVARELIRRDMKSKIHIFLTLDESEKYTKEVLNTIKPYHDIISNIGKISKDEIPSVYNTASALFMPTLVESFGLIYLEAMKYGCPIITSDRDFSKWICGDLALYFDPISAISIVDTIEVFTNNFIVKAYREKALKRLDSFPNSWKEVAEEYLNILKIVN